MSWQFATAGRVVFGRGTLQYLGSVCQRLKLTRPLIVSDQRLAHLGLLDRASDLLVDAAYSVAIYDGCVAEPPTSCAIEAVEVGRKVNADGIIAIGGGSNMDVGKMAATLLAHSARPEELFGFNNIPGPVLPVIAIPTTAGTGSEVSHSSVLTDVSAGVKVSTLSPFLRPAAAIVDPSLTDSCPASVTAHSGIDALVHAIEALTAREHFSMPEPDPMLRAYDGSNPFTKVLATEAIRLVGKSLRTAVDDGTNQSARDDMALAALLAGMAFSNSGVAIVHALEYPIGALTHCSHGEGNGLLLPHVMRFNASARPSEMNLIGELISGKPMNSEGLSDADAAESAIRAIVELQNAIGIRTRLRDLGLAESALPVVAAKAFQIKRLMDTNPVRPTEADLLGILKAAF